MEQKPTVHSNWHRLPDDMFYGANVWDPWLILAQIITVQCLFYLSFGLLLYVFLGEPLYLSSLRHEGSVSKYIRRGCVSVMM